jgi:hypothetical protein
VTYIVFKLSASISDYCITLVTNFLAMNKSLSLILTLSLFATTAFGQFSIILEDNFNRPDNVSPGSTDNGLNWIEGGNETGAISNQELIFSTESVDAREWATANLSTISPYWNPVLTENTAPIEWTFNMQTNCFKVAGVGPTQNAVVYVLASNSSNFEEGEGYAVLFGNPGSPDRLRLVNYTNGLKIGSNLTGMIYGGTIGTNDYIAVKVIYDPVVDSWTLQYEANPTGFTDPAVASFSTIGTVTNSTYTTSGGFVFTGPMFTHNSIADHRGKFDNLLIIQEWVLPITLQTFEAFPLGNDVSLNWITGTEIDNDFFTIEHSLDGNQFTPLANIDGAGTSVIENQYNFEHNNLPAGTHYYRLKQTDFNGRFEYSDVITAHIDGSFHATNLSPNPAAGELMVSMLQTADQSGTLSVVNLAGQILMEQTFNAEEGYNNFQVSLGNLPSGVYMLKIAGNSGETESIQFVKL